MFLGLAFRNTIIVLLVGYTSCGDACSAYRAKGSRCLTRASGRNVTDKQVPCTYLQDVSHPCFRELVADMHERNKSTYRTRSWRLHAHTRPPMFFQHRRVVEGKLRLMVQAAMRALMQPPLANNNQHEKQRRDRLIPINWHGTTACIIRMLRSMQYEACVLQLSQCAMLMAWACICCALSSVGDCHMMLHSAQASALKQQLRRAKGSLHPMPRAKGSPTRHRRLILHARHC